MAEPSLAISLWSSCRYASGCGSSRDRCGTCNDRAPHCCESRASASMRPACRRSPPDAHTFARRQFRAGPLVVDRGPLDAGRGRHADRLRLHHDAGGEPRGRRTHRLLARPVHPQAGVLPRRRRRDRGGGVAALAAHHPPHRDRRLHHRAGAHRGDHGDRRRDQGRATLDFAAWPVGAAVGVPQALLHHRRRLADQRGPPHAALPGQDAGDRRLPADRAAAEGAARYRHAGGDHRGVLRATLRRRAEPFPGRHPADRHRVRRRRRLHVLPARAEARGELPASRQHAPAATTSRTPRSRRSAMADCSAAAPARVASRTCCPMRTPTSCSPSPARSSA